MTYYKHKVIFQKSFFSKEGVSPSEIKFQACFLNMMIAKTAKGESSQNTFTIRLCVTLFCMWPFSPTDSRCVSHDPIPSSNGTTHRAQQKSLRSSSDCLVCQMWAWAGKSVICRRLMYKC